MFIPCRLAVLTLAFTVLPALAQTPTPKTCERPEKHPGRIASIEKQRAWAKEANVWQDCMKKYIGDLGAKADEAVKAANAAVAESNAAIAAYNADVKELQAQAEAAK